VLLIDVAKVVKLGQNTLDKFSEINPFRLDCEVYNESALKNLKKMNGRNNILQIYPLKSKH
jgi:hypothetical protein